MENFRRLEDSVLGHIAINEFLQRLRSENPRAFAVVAALGDGMSVIEVSEGFGRSKNTLYQRIQEAAEVAIEVFGQDDVKGRQRTGRKNWI